MRRAHKMEMYPTPDQAAYIDRAIGAARHAYNQCFFHFKDQRWSKREARTYFKTVVRAEHPWYAEISAAISENAIDRLDAAYQNFFRRVKRGVRPAGFPTPARLGVNDSFTIRNRPKFKVEGRRLRFEKFNMRGKPIRLSQELRWASPTSITISRSAGRYFVSFGFDLPDNDDAPPAGAVGVDLGVKSLATLSNGDVIPSNDKLKKSLKRLKRKQRRLSRARKGSNRRAKAKLSLQKLHRRIRNQRHDVLHQLTNRLTKDFGTICIEDLNVKGMTRNRRLARSIADAGFGEFRRQLEYKAEARGCTVVAIDRWYPSSKTCSCCGTIKDDLTLSDRTFECADCGHKMDRDLNAALNILYEGTDASPSLIPTRPESVSQGTQPCGTRYEPVDQREGGRDVALVAL